MMHSTQLFTYVAEYVPVAIPKANVFRFHVSDLNLSCILLTGVGEYLESKWLI